MMQQKLTNITSESSKRSWGNVTHLAYNILLPIILLVLVLSQLEILAVLGVFFSKWRTFAVKPRHLLANIRSNAVDFIVKLSTLSFMISSDTIEVKIIWTIWYIIWLTLIKPRSDTTWVSIQAVTAQFLGLSAVLQLKLSFFPEISVLLFAWIIGYVSARHFLSSYEEPWMRSLSYIWGLFVTQITWVLYRWLLVYTIVPQLVLVLTVVSYVLMSIYHMQKNNTLSTKFMKQQIVMSTLLLFVIVIIGNWQGEV